VVSERSTVPWRPFLVLGVSVSLTILAVWFSLSTAEAKDRLRFDNRTQRAEDLIRSRVESYIVLLRAAGYFFASKTPGSANPEDLRSFVDRLDMARAHPGLTRIGYTRRLLAGEDESVAAAMRAAGGPEFRVRPEGKRPVRFPIVFLEPESGFESRIGYDVLTDPVLGPALRRAGERAAPSASAIVPASLVDVSASQAGFFLFVPIYRDGVAPAAASARREALEGFVHGVFRLDGLLRDLHSGPVHPGIAFEVYSGAGMDAASLLYQSDRMSTASRAPEFTATAALTIAGQPWTVRYVTVPPFGEGSTRGQGLLALILGLSASGALFGAAWSQHQATARLRKSEDDVRRLNLNLERRVGERTTELEQANKELEAFSYSVSHDLRGPLRSLNGFSQMLVDQYAERLDPRGRDYLQRVLAAAVEMGDLIDGFLKLARVARQEMKMDTVDLSALAEAVARDLRALDPGRTVEFRVEPGIAATGDAALLRVVLENLLGNAWKFTSKRGKSTIEFGLREGACFVRDDGAGFDMADASRLFRPFERLHAASDFPGTGIGLATVHRVVERHGGTLRAEAAPGRGAAFFFTLSDVHRGAAVGASS
jgi:signal transduction histidine kinase